MTLQAYFDESEKDGYYAVGGYIAPVAVWRSWSDKWYASLKESPKLGYFRSADALALGGQFKRFTEAQRDARVLALAETFPADNFFRVHAHMSLKDYNQFFSREIQGTTLNPFYLCAFHVVSYLNTHLLTATQVPRTVNYIFDKNQKVRDNFVWVSALFAALSEKAIFPFIGDFQFEDKNQFLPLQAADMCVSWARRRASQIGGVLASDAIVARQRHLCYVIDPELMRRFADSVTDEKKLEALLENLLKQWRP